MSYARNREGGQEKGGQACIIALKDIQLVNSDACVGPLRAEAEYFPEAHWQRRVVHLLLERIRCSTQCAYARRLGRAEGGPCQ